MKNLIRICSFLTLIVTFSFISANAQTVQRMEADIPFAFNVGAKSYDAGNYVLKLSERSMGKVVTLEDNDSKILNTFFVMDGFDSTSNNFLRFVRSSDDSLYLSKIFTSNKSFRIPNVMPKSKNKGGVFAGDTQTVSVNIRTIY